MVVRKSATRRYFSAEALIRFYQGRLPANVEGPTETQQPAKAPKATDHTTDTRPLISTEEIASQLVQRVGPLIANEVAQALAPIATMLRRIDGGLNDLASTRTTLMLKYDAEATQHAQRLEEAKAEIRRLKGLSDQDQQLQRIRLDISRLLDTIAQMQNRDE